MPGSDTAECGNIDWEGQAWVKDLQVTPGAQAPMGPLLVLSSPGKLALLGRSGPLGSAAPLSCFFLKAVHFKLFVLAANRGREILLLLLL